MLGHKCIFLFFVLGAYGEEKFADTPAQANAEATLCEGENCPVAEQDANAVPAAKGKIVSCSGCSLNRYHDLRRWLKTDEMWRHWQNLDLQWRGGANPELFIFDDAGNTKEVIDLKPYNYQELAPMLEKKGFKRKTQTSQDEL